MQIMQITDVSIRWKSLGEDAASITALTLRVQEGGGAINLHAEHHDLVSVTQHARDHVHATSSPLFPV